MEDFDFQGIIDLFATGDPVAIGLAILLIVTIAGTFIAKKTETDTDNKIFSKIYKVLSKLTIKKKK